MEQLRSRVRAFLAEVSPPAAVRRLMEDERGYDLDVWLRLAADHDLLALGGWPERAVVLQETGRVLLCAPYLATVTAAPLLPPDVRDAIAGGLCIATIAVAEASGRWDAGGVTTRAVRSPGGRWRLEGEKSYVVDGCAADVLVVAARIDGAGDVALFQVDAGAPGVDRAPLATVDPTRRQARVTLAAAPARRLEASPAMAVDLGAVALAAEQVGGAERALEMAVEHAGRRIQFGRPIGSFQAVKHLCAEMVLELESARAAATHAAGSVDTGDLAEAAAVAKVACSEAFVRIATDSLHVHGGLGFTWDHDAHLYLRRARSSLHLFGDPRHHRERLARLLGL
ncbi:MAG TPA: acyl-CoA dehydrogenase family protein [Acidimicrobiales bacterium]|nr:acyl-CoA dehydrogenase family protein [Acidimicrobiales bacterium]